MCGDVSDYGLEILDYRTVPPVRPAMAEVQAQSRSNTISEQSNRSKAHRGLMDTISIASQDLLAEDIRCPLSVICSRFEERLINLCHEVITDNINPLLQLKSPVSLGQRYTSFDSPNGRIHVETSYEPSGDGQTLLFRIFQDNRRQNMLEYSETAAIKNIGRVSGVRLAYSPGLAYTLMSFVNTALTKFTRILEDGYDQLKALILRKLSNLATYSATKALEIVRNNVSETVKDKIWLYALIREHGVSLTDNDSQKKALCALISHRGLFQSSPLEAAVALIAVEMERSRSFSQRAVLARDSIDGVPIGLRNTSYDRIIQDAEVAFYGSEQLETLSMAHLADVDIVSAYPIGLRDFVRPQLVELRPKFNQVLYELYEDLLFLLGQVNVLTAQPVKQPLGTSMPRIRVATTVSSNRAYRLR